MILKMNIIKTQVIIRRLMNSERPFERRTSNIQGNTIGTKEVTSLARAITRTTITADE